MDTRSVRRPFVSASQLLKTNRMVHGWSNAAALLPHGSGFCLDLGAGDGKHRSQIERAGWHWIGIDVVSHRNLTTVADAQQLPLVANSIDVVFTSQVLEHVPFPWLAVAEAFRVLKPGGQFIGSVSFLEPFHDSYFGFSHWAIEELLKGQGFEISEIRPGSSAFVVLASAMLPDMRMGSTIGKWVGRVSVGFLKVFGGLYTAIRFGTGSHKWQEYRDFLVKAPLRFAGHILFVARKPAC